MHPRSESIKENFMKSGVNLFGIQIGIAQTQQLVSTAILELVDKSGNTI